jgi:hypothetical protein
MSEYQYYEFLTIDRPLDHRQQTEVRALSTRATITATRFVNEYHWGDLRGDPRRGCDTDPGALRPGPGVDERGDVWWTMRPGPGVGGCGDGSGRPPCSTTPA